MPYIPQSELDPKYILANALMVLADNPDGLFGNLSIREFYLQRGYGVLSDFEIKKKARK